MEPRLPMQEGAMRPGKMTQQKDPKPQLKTAWYELSRNT